MMRPAYFVVSLLNGRETPAIYWDELPRAPIPRLVYVLRLDQQPNAKALCEANLAKLYAVFCHMRKRGKLPPKYEPPPRKAENGPAKLKEGHREYHSRRFLPDLPYEA